MTAQDILDQAMQAIGRVIPSINSNDINSATKIVSPVSDVNTLNEQWKRDYVAKNVALEDAARNENTTSINKSVNFPDWMANSPVTPTATPTPQNGQVLSNQTQNDFQGLTQVKPQGDIANLVLSSAKKSGISPALLASLLFTESGYNPKAQNGGDYGVAQINLASHPDVTEQQAYDPSFAIPWAADYLSKQNNNFNDINRAIASYNVGTGGASIRGSAKFGGGPNGQDYLDKVIKNLSPELIKKLGLISGQ